MSNTQIELECMLLENKAEPKALPFKLLDEITNGFSDELEIGRGGFAVVYQGMLGTAIVAVKKLLPTAYMHEEQFHREVECLMKVKHKNIVRFLGYCADTQGNMVNYNGKMVMADVQKRLLCFEYLSKGSLVDHITASPSELEWKKRYHVIKGICNGLNYLHQNNIVHLDLKPGNILMDEDMIPKIADFGLSRCFEEDQTRLITTNMCGTLGYLAPEYVSGEITPMFDLYSLGVIILEMLTRKKGQQTIDDVLEIWIGAELGPGQWEQIQVCFQIGIECIDADPAKRPASVKHIIDRIVETEYSTPEIQTGGTCQLLLLDQSMLRFPFEPNKVITCPLHLTNNTDKYVAFRLKDNRMESSFLRLPLCGVVPPKTPYTLIVLTEEQEECPRKYSMDLRLECATLVSGERNHIYHFEGNPDTFFQEMGDAVEEVKLTAFTLPQCITTSPSKQIWPTVKIISCKKGYDVYGGDVRALDTDQAKQWIITGDGSGYFRIWDYKLEKKVHAVKVSAAVVGIVCVIFIARKQWIVAGTSNGNVHVYGYEKMQTIKKFSVGSYEQLSSLVVHPTQPYLLSVGVHMRLWDWDKGWKCIQTFEYSVFDEARHVVFITNDTFASAGEYTVKVWSLDSPKSNYTLLGHSDMVTGLDFFTCDNQEFLVTGSDDKTVKIWSLQEKTCIYTLEAFVSEVTSVLYQPNLRTLITGSQDGCIYLWSVTNGGIRSCCPTLERIINVGYAEIYSRGVHSLACLLGGVVIGTCKAVAVMDIDNVSYQEQPVGCNDQHLRADTRQHARDTTCKQEIPLSINKLLDVHPLELCFPYHPNELMPCSMQLANNTDENVAFRLVDKSGKSPWCFAKLPLYGIVPRRSTYTLIVTTKEEMKQKKISYFDLVIQCCFLRSERTVVFDDKHESDQFFEETKDCGSMVHEVALKAVYGPEEETTSENISVNYNRDELYSLDAHPTEPWILTGHRSGYAHVWNHEMKDPMSSFKVFDGPDRGGHGGSCDHVKFVAKREWIVAGTHGCNFLVYDCACVTKLEKIAHVKSSALTRTIVVVHPTLPNVLSVSSSLMVLLDMNLDWMSTKLFCSDNVRTLALNPGDSNSFASGSSGGAVQVWRFDSHLCEYSLYGHLGAVHCLDYITHGDQHYLISGSEDYTAKIWDLQKRECICTLEAKSPVLCVLVHPSLPVLITGTQHGIIQTWSSTDFRLKRTINLGGGGEVVSLGCLSSSSRIVIGQRRAICTMQIQDDGALRPKSATEALRAEPTPRTRRRRQNRCAPLPVKGAEAEAVTECAVKVRQSVANQRSRLQHKSSKS